MGHIIADEPLASQLRAALEPAEIRDSSGRVLGRFTPDISAKLRETFEEAASFDLEEARRRVEAHEPGQGRTTAQVLARLKSLESGK